MIPKNVKGTLVKHKLNWWQTSGDKREDKRVLIEARFKETSEIIHFQGWFKLWRVTEGISFFDKEETRIWIVTFVTVYA